MCCPSSRSSSLSSRSTSSSRGSSRGSRFLQLAHDREHGSPPVSRRSSRAPPSSRVVDFSPSSQHDNSRPSTRSSLPPDALTSSWQMLTPGAASYASSDHARGHVRDTIESPIHAADLGQPVGSWPSQHRGSPARSSPIGIKQHIHDRRRAAPSSPLAMPIGMVRSGSRSSPMPIARLSANPGELRTLMFGDTLKPSRPSSRTNPSPLASFESKKAVSVSNLKSEAVQIPASKPALAIRTGTENFNTSSTHCEEWCSDQLVATTASLSERHQTVSGAITSVDEALKGGSAQTVHETGDNAVIEHFLESLGHDTLPTETSLAEQQTLAPGQRDLQDAPDHNRPHGQGQGPARGAFQDNSSGRLGPGWKSAVGSGPPAYPGANSSGPSGEDDPPPKRPHTGIKRKRPTRTGRFKYPCVFFGSTNPEHEVTRDCGGRRQYVSQLRRHHERHGFCYCKKCFRHFPTAQARDEHFASEPCLPMCLDENCPNYGTPADMRHFRCTHPSNITLRDIWRYLFQLARPRDLPVPDPDLEILGSNDTTSPEVDDIEPQQSQLQFMPLSVAAPQQVVTTTNALAQPLQPQMFEFDWDAFVGQQQPTDTGMTTIAGVRLHSRQLSALAEELQPLEGALDPAAARTLEHLLEDVQYLERRMTGLRDELRRNLARQQTVNMLRTFGTGAGSSFGS